MSIDIVPLVYFRIAFGTIILWEVVRYFDHGWIGLYYTEPIFHFTYYGFDWVRPWPGIGMYLHFVALGGLAVFIALGFMYRLSMVLFFLGFSYVFLLDQAYYLNHFYLIAAIGLLMIFIPAHRAFSVDAWLRPDIRATAAPALALWVLLAMIGIAYFYGGLAKLNGDWLRGEPMGIWLSERTERPLFDYVLSLEPMAYLFSYGGLFFDLLIVPLLLWRRTRVLAFVAALAFHLTNAGLFQIGIFPFFMIAATVLFFPPPWPRPREALRLAGHVFSSPRNILSWLVGNREPRGEDHAAAGRERPGQLVMLALLGVYFAWHLLVPFRHYLYPGNSSWTEEGERFAWHMKHHHKVAGPAEFFVTDPSSNETVVVDPDEYLNRKQVTVMSWSPDMILQFSHFIANERRETGGDPVEVRAEIPVSLNGREPRMIVDPTVDLASQPRTLMPVEWITPMEEPLPTR